MFDSDESGMPRPSGCGRRMRPIPRRVPLDAELFVASQPIAVPFADPWSELTQPESARRYRSTLRRIVRRLRGELKREVGRAERLIAARPRHLRSAQADGRDFCPGVFHRGRASRAGRSRGSLRRGRWRSAPHLSALREASLALLPTDLYPAETHFAAHEVEPDLKPRVEKLLLSLN